MAIYYLDLTKKYKDRFDLAKFIEYSDDCFDILTTFILPEIKKLPVRYTRTITFEEQNPELISWFIYGDPQYDWILMEYNDLTDISEVVTGLEIKAPSLNEMEALYFNLVAKKTEQIKEDVKNTQVIVSL